MKVWDDVERAYQERRVVMGRVIERVKGGLAVDIGVRAFLPGSQVDVRPVRNLDALRGQELRMRVIKVNKKRGNIVLSRKAVLEEENAERKTQTRWRRSRRARSSPAWSRTSPSTAPSSTSAASTACSTSPTCRGAASTTRARC